MDAIKGQKSLLAAVTAITATLLGSGTSASAKSKTIDSSLLLYGEKGRVLAAEGVIDFGVKLSERRSLGLRLVWDALTGASPNGATPSSQIQTFTGPSGSNSYAVNPGEIPLDNTFSDKRGALDATLLESIDRVTFVNVGAHMSFEHDYTSLGLNGGITRDFNRRNTTLGVALAYSHDTVSPIGGAPVPFSSMPPPTSGEDGGEGDDDEGGEPGPGRGKDIVDVVVGMTQILGRNTIFRANYSVNQSAGYLNDPYKIMSVVQDRNSAAPGEPVDYIFENRPDSRRKQAVFGEVKRHIAGRTLTLSYRHFWDDWGIKSNTAEVFLRMPLVGTQIIEPHFRWYRQSKSVFFSEYLIEGQRLPQYGSADSRLSAFDAYTAGLLYIKPLGETAQLRLTAEYYTQRGTRAPPEDFGVLSQHGLFPELDVIMLRVGYSIAF